MPTYEYHCDACDHDFEKFQSMSAEPIKVCPKCGKRKVRRLIGTGAGMIFKGSGFYITDYRDKGYQEKAKAESGGGEKSADKPGEKKEAKPESTPAKSEPTAKPESHKPTAGKGKKKE